jgi:hypothetical protein
VVRVFDLGAALDRLPKNAVFVAQAVPHGRDLQGGQRLDEAGREPAEAAVPQAGVGFLFEQAEPVEALLLDGLPGEGVEQEVHHVVRQRAADQELHRQVVDPLGVLPRVDVLRAHPPLGEDVANGAGKGLELLAGAGVRELGGVVEEEVSLVERAVRPGKLDRAAAVLSAEFRQAVGRRGRRRGRRLLRGHAGLLSRRTGNSQATRGAATLMGSAWTWG